LFASPQDADARDELTDFALEALDLLVLGRLLVARPSAQCVLASGEELLLPAFDLGDGQAVFASCLCRRSLTLHDAQNHGRFALRRRSAAPRQERPS